MKITTGENKYEILDSGTVISFEGESLTFELAADLKVIMSFKQDKEINGQKMDFKEISPKELEIILINFNNSLGTANVSPLDIATIGGKKTYLNFIVHSIDNSQQKTIHYTWYLREEVKNG
jgi:hypothetical protein